jgi:anti-sigma regulatory factor (Ser/Thr protein kinase)
MRNPLHQRLPVDPRTPALARRLLRQWLDSGNWPVNASDDLVLAVNEAITNAVEHAFSADHRGGGIELDAHAEAGEDRARRVVVTVTDDGRWRPPPSDAGFRGRGLDMIRALVESLTVSPAASGTRVTMTSLPTADPRSLTPDRTGGPHAHPSGTAGG